MPILRKGGIGMKGELNRTVMIYVDAYDNKVPVGRFHIASEQEIQKFHGLTQLLLKINRSLDRENFPQSFSELRKFQMPSREAFTASQQLNQKRGDKATISPSRKKSRHS